MQIYVQCKWVTAHCKGNLTECWGVNCERVTYHLQGKPKLLVASYYRNQNTAAASSCISPDVEKTILQLSAQWPGL